MNSKIEMWIKNAYNWNWGRSMVNWFLLVRDMLNSMHGWWIFRFTVYMRLYTKMRWKQILYTWDERIKTRKNGITTKELSSKKGCRKIRPMMKWIELRTKKWLLIFLSKFCLRLCSDFCQFFSQHYLTFFFWTVVTYT